MLLLLVGFSVGAMLAYQLGTTMYPSYMSGIVVSIINMASMISGIILMPVTGSLIKMSWNGTVKNGVEIYSVADFRFGFLSVLIALGIGIILAFFVKDQKQANAG
jgi:MFS family permease